MDLETKTSGFHPRYVKAEISSMLRECCKRHNCDECIWQTMEVLRHTILDMLQKHLKVEDVLEYLYDHKPPDALSKFWWDMVKQLGVMIDKIYNKEWAEESPEKFLK